jgi:hypothetical protein
MAKRSDAFFLQRYMRVATFLWRQSVYEHSCPLTLTPSIAMVLGLLQMLHDLLHDFLQFWMILIESFFLRTSLLRLTIRFCANSFYRAFQTEISTGGTYVARVFPL